MWLVPLAQEPRASTSWRVCRKDFLIALKSPLAFRQKGPPYGNPATSGLPGQRCRRAPIGVTGQRPQWPRVSSGPGAASGRRDGPGHPEIRMHAARPAAHSMSAGFHCPQRHRRHGPRRSYRLAHPHAGGVSGHAPIGPCAACFNVHSLRTLRALMWPKRPLLSAWRALRSRAISLRRPCACPHLRGDGCGGCVGCGAARGDDARRSAPDLHNS